MRLAITPDYQAAREMWNVTGRWVDPQEVSSKRPYGVQPIYIE